MRVSVFLDGANFFYMQKDALKQFIDPKKLLDYISSNFGEIQDAFYYMGQDATPDNRQQGYLDALPYMGFSVITKQIKTVLNQESGQLRQKANLDIEIVLDMFNTIDNYDMAVLISGDGDFDRALQLLRARGKKFKVFSTERCIARELIQTAGMHYLDFSKIIDQIKKESI
ncbi:MAG: NYN domain-containing protein [Dehalococcoidia bacterium]|nr:NYN domain-containing protein [Dehalococcoidia bacterium]